MNTVARRIVGLLSVSVLLGAGAALLRTGVYGLTLFLILPVLLGGLAAWVFQPRTSGGAGAAGALTTLVASGTLLLLGLEGAICILMSWPLVLPLGALGGWLVWRSEPSRLGTGSLTSLLLLAPATLTFDTVAKPPVFEVRTTIEIAAPPEQVWQHVVSFTDLPEPREWFFRAGLAYPKRARIEGSGVGAVRYCDFSTGPFVEPIEVWDQPRMLRFRVTANPPPMEEWSPYPHVPARHLHGYLISKQGQFRLIPQGNDRTLLEGTTWYQHGLWPAEYWRWWSDAVIHRIHLRVLTHIRTLTEYPRVRIEVSAQTGSAAAVRPAESGRSWPTPDRLPAIRSSDGWRR